jgi:small multidrug resistance pump
MNPTIQGWLFLLAAILMEVSGTTCLKLSEQFTRLWPSLLMFGFYGLSLAGLNFALKTIDLSVAYAVWSALGIMLVSMIGMGWFKEPVSAMKIGCLLLVVVGVVGLQLSGSHAQ